MSETRLQEGKEVLNVMECLLFYLCSLVCREGPREKHPWVTRLSSLKNCGYLSGVDFNDFISLAQDIENDECIFKEVLTKTFYDNYLSYKYSGKDLLLGLMRTGVAVAVPEVAAQQHHEYETRFVTKLSQ